jgi:hypothetical protein
LDGEKVFFKDQVLKVWHANADARLHVARKTKAPDDWDSPYESYDPYGPGGVAGDEFIDDRNSVTARCNAVTAGNRFLVVARPCAHPPRARNTDCSRGGFSSVEPNSMRLKSAAISTRIGEAIAPTKPKRSRHSSWMV